MASFQVVYVVLAYFESCFKVCFTQKVYKRLEDKLYLAGPVLLHFVNRVLVLVIIYNFSNQLLQWVKPHTENCAHFCKTVNVTRIVMSTHVANI